MMYVLKQQHIDYMRQLAIAQLIADNKNTEHFDSYKQAMFPWIEVAKKRDSELFRKVLEEEVKRGPMTVRSLATPKVNSRLIKRVERASVPNTRLPNWRDNVYG